MKRKGVATSVVDIIENTYLGSSTRIQMQGKYSKQIDIKRGVKQGCPLSPVIFNIALDNLIRDLEKHKELGYQVGTDRFTVQAYADDVLLISNSEQNMNLLIERVRRFTEESGMELATEKCTAYVYGISKTTHRRYYEADIRIGNKSIKVEEKEKAIRYLGAPITARRNDRIKNNKITEADFRMLLTKITESKLAFTQKVDAIKKFLLPKWEYEFMVNQTKIKTLDRMDRAVRVSLNKLLGAKIPTAMYHASWKDGGLGIPSMKDRQEVATIRGLLCLLTSKHQKIRRLIETAMENERKKRRIGTTEVGPFFNWEITQEQSLTGTKGTNSITARACRAAMHLGIQLTKEEELEREVIKLKLDEENQIRVETQSAANERMLQLLRAKWREQIAQATFHMHSFISLANNKHSNAFTQRITKPAKDSFVRFAIKARTNTLPTQEFIEVINGQQHAGCPRCNTHTNNSLQHILNGCPANRKQIMERHDSIVNYLAEQLRKEEHSYVAKDSRITAVTLDENQLLKPDIQFWDTDASQVLLVEVNCPYAKSWEGQDSLEAKYQLKKEKYRDLLRELQDKGVRAKLIVIVVSSLGAVYKETEKEIRRLIPSFKKANKICRAISSLAILGSAKIWWATRRRHQEEQQRIQDDPNTTSEEEDNNNFAEEGEHDFQQLPAQVEVDIEENERWASSQDITLIEPEEEEEEQEDNNAILEQEVQRMNDSEEEEETPEWVLNLFR